MFNFNPKDWKELFFFLFFLLIFLLVKKARTDLVRAAGSASPCRGFPLEVQCGLVSLCTETKGTFVNNCEIYRDVVGAMFVRVIFRRPGALRAWGMEQAQSPRGLHGCFWYGKAYSKQSMPMRVAFLCALKRTSGNYCAVSVY